MNKVAFVVALAVAAAGFALLSVHKQRFEDRVAGGEPALVVVATRDIPLGARLSEDMIAIRSLPSAYVENRHVKAADAPKILGVRVSLGVRANESVMWTDLATVSAERRDLSGLVERGMRAVTVRTSSESTFGGLLRPGDRVDVLLTLSRETDRVTLPLLQNLLVLAVGSDTGAARAGGDGTMVSRGSPDITLSATVAQAQALTHASSEGDLTVVLRNPDDITVAQDLPETTSEDIRVAERLAKLQSRRRRAASDIASPTDTAQDKGIEHVE